MLENLVLAAYCALIAFGVSSTVMSIGKARAPISPGVALVVLFVGVAQVAALVYLSR